ENRGQYTIFISNQSASVHHILWAFSHPTTTNRGRPSTCADSGLGLRGRSRRGLKGRRNVSRERLPGAIRVEPRGGPPAEFPRACRLRTTGIQKLSHPWNGRFCAG